MPAQGTMYELRGRALYVNGELLTLTPGVVETAILYYEEETGKMISWSDESPTPVPWSAVEKMLHLQRMLDVSRLRHAANSRSA